jgi:hypothetical protein
MAQARAKAWLEEVAKGDPEKTRLFASIWSQESRSVVDRLADTFALGNPAVAKVLNEARNPAAPAPLEIPALLKDKKLPEFVRANVALAYAKALSNRRVHEEALQALSLFTPEQVVDPAGYLFHRLLNHAVDSPERYKTVGTLILLDMQAWKEKDLGAVARKMGNIERRLELARGGPQTQKLQKEVISRLDELIKELENKQKQGGS